MNSCGAPHRHMALHGATGRHIAPHGATRRHLRGTRRRKSSEEAFSQSRSKRDDGNQPSAQVTLRAHKEVTYPKLQPTCPPNRPSAAVAPKRSR
eukprot:gene12105-biopygen850